MILDEQILDLDLASDLADALRAVVASRNAETNRESGYISVRPTGRHIAAYFNRRFVDIAVTPDSSQGLHVQHPGTSVIRKTTTTHYLHVPDGLLDSDTLVALVVAALDWRERGHRWNGAAGPAGRWSDLAGEVCAVCNLQIAANGECSC